MRTQKLYKKNNSPGDTKGGKDTPKKASSMVRPKEEGASGGWGWFLFKFVLFGLAITGAYVGFTVYRARQRDRF